MSYIDGLAVKYIKGERNKDYLIGLTIIFSAFILSFTLSFATSNQLGVQKITKYMPQITILNKPNEVSKLKSDESIEKIITFNIIKEAKLKNFTANFMYLDNNDYFDSIEGKVPTNSNEVMNDIS